MKTLEQIEKEEQLDAEQWNRDWLKYEQIHQQAMNKHLRADGHYKDDRAKILAFAGITMGVVGLLSMAFIAAFLYTLSGQ